MAERGPLQLSRLGPLRRLRKRWCGAGPYSMPQYAVGHLTAAELNVVERNAQSILWQRHHGVGLPMSSVQGAATARLLTGRMFAGAKKNTLIPLPLESRACRVARLGQL